MSLELAQRGADWVEIIIFLLVVGISAFTAIGQALIKKFGGKKGESDQPTTIEPRRPVSRRDAHPRPVARPMPPRQARPASTTTGRSDDDEAKRSWTERVELPKPLREVLSEVMPDLVPPKPAKKIERSSGQPVAGSTSGSDAASRGPDHREFQVPPARPVAPGQVKKVRLRPAKPAPKARPAPTPTPVAGRSAFEQSLDRFDDHLGQLAYDMDSFGASLSQTTSEWDTPTVAPGFEYLHDPSAATLRRAVVMSEILAPPLALRPTKYPTP